MKNPFVATRCNRNAATAVLLQSPCVMRRMGSRNFPGKGAKSNPIKKSGYTWRQAKTCREMFNQINVLRPYFLRSQNILFENLSLATMRLLVFPVAATIFEHVLSPFQAKCRTFSRGLMPKGLFVHSCNCTVHCLSHVIRWPLEMLWNCPLKWKLAHRWDWNSLAIKRKAVFKRKGSVSGKRF